jgi:hypothetical protein
VTDAAAAVTVPIMQRAVGLLVLALVLFWIIDSPATAAATVSSILVILADWAAALVQFLRALF